MSSGLSLTAYESLLNLNVTNLRAFLDSGTPRQYEQCRARRSMLDDIKREVADAALDLIEDVDDGKLHDDALVLEHAQVSCCGGGVAVPWRCCVAAVTLSMQLAPSFTAHAPSQAALDTLREDALLARWIRPRGERGHGPRTSPPRDAEPARGSRSGDDPPTASQSAKRPRL